MSDYYITSVADVYMYNVAGDTLLATAKTLMDSSISVTSSNTDVRGGKGNQLQFIYFHSGDMSITLSDVQFNLDLLAQNMGASLVTGDEIYYEENITLDGSLGGSVTNTPVAVSGSTTYGWVTHVDGSVERVTFSTKAFTATSGSEGDVVCVRYFNTDAAVKSLDIYSNLVPKKVRLVMDAQLADGSESSAAVVGKTEIIVPTFQLSGSFDIAMTADQVANTPLTGRALATATSDQGCTANKILAKVIRKVDSANWYDDATALAIVGGDVALAVAGTETMSIKSLYSDGAIGTPPVADLTFATDDAGVATVAAGVITGVGAGTCTITVSITADTSIDASVVVTVS